MKTSNTTEDRIAELEDQLRERDEKLKRLTADHDEALELVSKLREQAEDNNALIERLTENWEYEAELWGKQDQLFDENQQLTRKFNKFVAEYNAVVAPREQGRPLAASKVQQAEILKHHKDGKSLRAIAANTGISLRTVRTVVEKSKGTDRTSKRTNELRRKTFNRLRAAEFRARRRDAESLPRSIEQQLETGKELIKAAKGLR